MRTLSSTKNLPLGVGVDGLPTTAANARTRRPWRNTRTILLDVLTTMCQLVVDRTVPRFAIQPVRPFGRPGTRTRSHSPPPLLTRASTGSTVGPPVIGRRARTVARRDE
jgi:hypothetical protein